MTDVAAGVVPTSRNAFRHPQFTRFWIGALLSSTGTAMQSAAVPFVLYDLTGRALWLGAAALAQLGPMALLGPFGGALADRVSRKKLLLGTQCAAGLASFGLWGMWVAGVRSPWAILVPLVLIGIAAGLMLPAWQAFVSDLVPRDVVASAVTLNSAQFNASRALGPTIAGFALAAVGAGPVFFFNAVSFLGVIFALLTVGEVKGDPRGEDVRHIFHQLIDGARHVRSQPNLKVAIGIVSIVAFLAMPVSQLLPVFARDVFHVGADGYGVLAGAIGVGAIVGAVVLSTAGKGARRSKQLRLAVFAYGAALVIFASSSSLVLALPALVLVGLGHISVVSALQTSIHLGVDARFRGRVLSFYALGFTLCVPLGAMLQSALVEAFGPRRTVAVAGCVLAVVAGLLARPARLLDRGGADPDAV